MIKHVRRFSTYVMLLGWALVSITPLIMLTAAALNTSAVARRPDDILLMRGFTLDNFVLVIQTGGIIPLFVNSVVYALCVVVIGVAVSTTIAFGLNKIAAIASARIGVVILCMRYIPYIVIAIPLFTLFVVLGISGSRIGVLIAHLSLVLPLTTWLVIGFFKDVPYEIEESALIDGCGPFRVYWSISLPLARPGVISAAILAVIASWNDLLFGVMLGGRESRTIATGVFRWVGTEGQAPDYGVIAAYSLLIVLPVILFVIITSKYIISGLTQGAVK